MKELHGRTYGFCDEISLYSRLQRAGFYWPSIGKDVDLVQTQCEACHLVADREESYAIFTNKDWRSPFVQYLTEGILPQKYSKKYKLKRLAVPYFLHEGILFRKWHNGDPLRCLGPKEAREMIMEVHARECGKHQGKKKLY